VIPDEIKEMKPNMQETLIRYKYDRNMLPLWNYEEELAKAKLSWGQDIKEYDDNLEDKMFKFATEFKQNAKKMELLQKSVTTEIIPSLERLKQEFYVD
jgi:hypothetical protein